MEDLLLVFDELDDVVSTVGLIWRPILSFLVAVALFMATGWIFFSFPVAAELIAFSLVSLGLLEMLRQRIQNQAILTGTRAAGEDVG